MVTGGNTGEATSLSVGGITVVESGTRNRSERINEFALSKSGAVSNYGVSVDTGEQYHMELSLLDVSSGGDDNTVLYSGNIDAYGQRKPLLWSVTLPEWKMQTRYCLLGSTSTIRPVWDHFLSSPFTAKFIPNNRGGKFLAMVLYFSTSVLFLLLSALSRCSAVRVHSV